MNKFILGTILMYLAGFSYATDLQVGAAEIVGYGIFDATSTTSAVGFTSSSIARDSAKGVSFVEYTNDIPAKLGVNFGIQYIVNSTPKGRAIQLTPVVKFPEPGLQRPKSDACTQNPVILTMQQLAEKNSTAMALTRSGRWSPVPGCLKSGMARLA